MQQHQETLSKGPCGWQVVGRPEPGSGCSKAVPLEPKTPNMRPSDRQTYLKRGPGPARWVQNGQPPRCPLKRIMPHGDWCPFWLSWWKRWRSLVYLVGSSHLAGKPTLCSWALAQVAPNVVTFTAAITACVEADEDAWEKAARLCAPKGGASRCFLFGLFFLFCFLLFLLFLNVWNQWNSFGLPLVFKIVGFLIGFPIGGSMGALGVNQAHLALIFSGISLVYRVETRSLEASWLVGSGLSKKVFPFPDRVSGHLVYIWVCSQ